MGRFTNKGSQAIEDSEKARQEAINAARSDRLDYFSVEEGKTAYLRLINEATDWLKVSQHSFVKTKPGPATAKKWPKGMGAVCRYDVEIAKILGAEDCYVCDKQLHSAFRDEFAKPTNRVWSLGVLRQQIKGDGSERLGGPAMNGKVIGMDDVWEEYAILDEKGNPTEKKALRPKLVIVNMSWNNFFSPFHHAWVNYGSACDRDYAVRRTGKGKDTDYSIMPIDKIESLMPGTDAWKRYAEQADNRIQDRTVMQEGDDPISILLEEIVLGQASEEHYARWFDPTKEVNKEGKVVPAGTTPVEPSDGAAPVVSEADEAEAQANLAALRARLMTGGAPA